MQLGSTTPCETMRVGFMTGPLSTTTPAKAATDHAGALSTSGQKAALPQIKKIPHRL
jgi:hypothetical protein